jgi:hypothetical protein
MNERWVVPIVVALVGLVGGLGGAYLGGRAANNGQQEQFENQRTAQVQDLLIATYSNFVRTASKAASGPASPAEVRAVFAAGAQVDFVGDEHVKRAARVLEHLSLTNPDEETYRGRQEDFVNAGLADIETP